MWRNWAGTVEAHPVRLASPADAAETAAVVKAAVRDGLRIKAVGSGHSFTAVAETDGALINSTRLSGLLSVDQDHRRVTVRAGTPLHVLNPLLAQHGLAMANLGDIDRQTIAGALSTGTHGTGLRAGGLSDQVAGFELVLADGSVVTCSAEERPELFTAARVGIGALGVVTAVTLQCEPVYALRATEAPIPLADVLVGFDELVASNDHFEFFWFPGTDVALTKRNNRVPMSELAPLTRRAAWQDRFMSNVAFEAVNRVATLRPTLTPRLNRVASGLLSPREYVDASYRVFSSPRRVVFREMEYALPRGSLVGVLEQVRAWLDRSGALVPFPLEVRVTPPSDAWLSPAYGRESGYIAVHQYHRLPYEDLFAGVEPILVEASGRPHWGKLHSLGADELRRRYPRFEDFLAVRDTVDPTGVFANPYLDRVLGPPRPW